MKTSAIGGSASASLGYQSAKLDTAQVNEQTGIHIGKEGMDVKVKGHTQLDGAVMTSEADKENNHFSTQSIASQDIENHSELKTHSVSVSGGTSGFNPMSALSLLGNKNEESHSTTKSAIGDNIQLETQDPNAKNINRNTQNTNDKVTKQDLAKAQDVQEAVGVVGEISNNLINIYTHKEREKIEQAKLALGKAKSQSASEEEMGKLSAELDRLQRQYDENYGIGSATKQAIEAVTATLQGLVAKDLSQAAVGLASPYLNEQIKRYTQNADGSTNQTTNLLAHALLGAVEAQVTGNNALAGVAAGAGGEAAATYLTEAIYHKKANELTDEEKRNVTFLSQVASGLAAGVVGDSTQSAVMGADIGKRAVENNALLHSDVWAFWRDLKQAIKEGKDVDEVYVYYQKLSQAQRESLLNECGETCRLPIEHSLSGATELADDYAMGLQGWFSNLSSEERSRFLTLVENENAKTLEALQNKHSFTENAIDFAISSGRMLQGEGIGKGGNKQSFAKSVKSSNTLLKAGDKPDNLSPIGAKRAGAFNEAKRQSGIPTSQQPSKVYPNVDKRGNPQPGVIYEFKVPKPGGGNKVITIRDDAKGHFYGENNPQNRGAHFNDMKGNHYDY